MNPPKLETVPTNSNNKNGASSQAAPTPAAAPAEKPTAKQRLLSVALPEDLHRKVRVTGLARGLSASALVEEYVRDGVRRDIGAALNKLSGE